MERKQLLEEEKGGSEKVQLVKTKKEQNRISQEKRMAQQGKMRLVEVEEKGMKGSYLIDPVPHYLLIQLLIHWLHHKQIWNGGCHVSSAFVSSYVLYVSKWKDPGPLLQ